MHKNRGGRKISPQGGGSDRDLIGASVVAQNNEFGGRQTHH